MNMLALTIGTVWLLVLGIFGFIFLVALIIQSNKNVMDEEFKQKANKILEADRIQKEREQALSPVYTRVDYKPAGRVRPNHSAPEPKKAKSAAYDANSDDIMNYVYMANTMQSHPYTHNNHTHTHDNTPTHTHYSDHSSSHHSSHDHSSYSSHDSGSSYDGGGSCGGGCD